ncbi:YwdI family protein [Anoxybacillus sp. J5B_2022]|uniref:YwdI family protein n=1 Tax=Anoxybacillus sp. J5B_2022 TaxID=3003246 RepID=UPI002285C559|nr:YwdI family protein [Anoxybacillus sp. J5B_2022]MCZ0754086.1 YwdI family protein [Anoxybacillus sp. J5B_2022]
MDVSVTVILAKMAALVEQAQQSDVRQMREHVAAVRVLCDLILEEKMATTVVQETALPKKLDIGDDANGTSLLDF